MYMLIFEDGGLQQVRDLPSWALESIEEGVLGVVRFNNEIDQFEELTAFNVWKRL